jgi:hypothetical protein
LSGALFAGIPQDTDNSGTNTVVYNPTTGEFEYTGSYGTGGDGNDDDWHITADNSAITSSRTTIITGSLLAGDAGNIATNNSVTFGQSTQATGENSQVQGISSFSMRVISRR